MLKIEHAKVTHIGELETKTRANNGQAFTMLNIDCQVGLIKQERFNYSTRQLELVDVPECARMTAYDEEAIALKQTLAVGDYVEANVRFYISNYGTNVRFSGIKKKVVAVQQQAPLGQAQALPKVAASQSQQDNAYEPFGGPAPF